MPAPSSCRAMHRLALALVLSLAFAAPRAAAQEFRVVDVGHLGSGPTTGWDLNDRGDITGYSGPRGSARAFRWTAAGGIEDLGVLRGTSASYGLAINDAGVVAGYSGLSFEDTRSFLDSGRRRPVELGDLGGGEAWARDLDNLGRVVGESKAADGAIHAFLWEDGVLTDLDPLLGSARSEAVALSDRGHVLGLADGVPFVLRAGHRTDLPDLGASARPRDINDFGDAVGFSRQAVGIGCTRCSPRAVLWSGGTVRNLGTLAPPGAANMVSSAMGLNNLRQVVGWSTTAPTGSQHAFVWDTDRGMRDLNDLVPDGWFVEWALDINDAGQIVAFGSYRGGTQRAFRLDPLDRRPVLPNPRPGEAGTVNRFEVLGAEPGGLVGFAVALAPGATPLPVCGVVLDLDAPLVLGGVRADAGGRALLDVPVPASLVGVDLVFQALDLDGCETTALTAQRF